MQQGRAMNSQTTAILLPARPHPLLLLLTAFPVACFSCALGTDIAYTLTSQMMWADFSDWLLAAGMAFGVLAAFAGVIDAIRNRRAQTGRRVAPLALGGLLILGVAFLNNLYHSRDAWTSVVPMGLTLSALTVLLIIITAWLATPRVARLPY